MAHGSGKVAKRYAKALFEALDSNSMEEALSVLNTLSDIWRRTPEVREALLNPALTEKRRLEAASQIMDVVSPGNKAIANFISLLVESKRIALLPEIASQFSTLVDQLKSALSLEIASAFEISSDERAAYEERIKRDFGSLAKIVWKVNPKLIGGMVIKSGDRLVDSSIKGSLERMTAQLLA